MRREKPRKGRALTRGPVDWLKPSRLRLPGTTTRTVSWVGVEVVDGRVRWSVQYSSYVRVLGTRTGTG